MKLTGEYVFTEYGVNIEGRIHDTHIAELREKFLSHGTAYVSKVYRGDVNLMVKAGIADPEGTRMNSLGSQWFNKMHSNNKFNAVKVTKDAGGSVGDETNITYVFQRTGLGVESGFASVMVQYRTRMGSRNHRMRYMQVKLANVGWVFDAVQPDGSFNVQLYGLVNRHILSVVLGKATIYAKILDHKDVLKASDEAGNLEYRGSW